MAQLPPLPPGAVLDEPAEGALPPSPTSTASNELPPGIVLDRPVTQASANSAIFKPGYTHLPEGFVLDSQPSQPRPETLPPLPPGAVLDQPVAAGTADLPEGFVLDGPPPAPGDDNPSIAGGFLRSFGQGATADFADEGVGLIGGNEAKKSYRKKLEKFEEEHPYLDMAAKGAGAVGSTAGLMLVPGGQLAALGRAGAMGQRVLAGLRSLLGAGNAAKAIPGANAAVNATVRAIPGVGRAAEIVAGTNARRGGLAAMEYGATDRAGKYEGAPNIEGDGRDDTDTLMDDAGERLSAAFDPSAMALDYGLGTGFTKALNGIMPRVGNAIDDTRTLIARASGETGADAGPVAVAKRLRADRVTPQQMRDQVLPEYRGMAQDDVSNIMERYGALIEGGADDQTARNTIAGELAQRGVNPRTAQTQVRQVVTRYQGRNAVPSQVNELAAMAQGGDAVATHRQFESGINMARDGSEASQVSQFMTGRQPAARGQISDALEGQLGDGDVGRMLQDYELRRGASNDLYGPVTEAFNNDPQAQQALQRAIDMTRLHVEAQLGNRADDMANTVRTQLGKFTNPETLMLPKGSPISSTVQGPRGSTEIQDMGRRGTMDLDGFIHQRRALTQAIESSKSPLGRDTATTHDLRELKAAIDRNVRGIADDTSHPEATRNIFRDWGAANDSRASLEAMQRAYTDGISLNVNAKGKSVINMEMTMRRVGRMSSDQQDMFARGLMARIKSDVETGGDFHDVAKLFTNQRMRGMLNRMMGADQAESFYQLVRRAGLATRSARADKNSPTARIRDEKESSMVLGKLKNAVDVFLSPGRALGAAADYADDLLFRKRNEDVMRILGANTDEPHRMIRTLRDLDAAMRYQDPTVITPFVRDGGPFLAMPFANGFAEADEGTWH